MKMIMIMIIWYAILQEGLHKQTLQEWMSVTKTTCNNRNVDLEMGDEIQLFSSRMQGNQLCWFEKKKQRNRSREMSHFVLLFGCIYWRHW